MTYELFLTAILADGRRVRVPNREVREWPSTATVAAIDGVDEFAAILDANDRGVGWVRTDGGPR